jgi:hypothetical protein
VIRKLGFERSTSMPFPPRVSKPVELLTLADLAAFPIWEWADEGEFEDRDETWVCPVDAQTVPRRSYTMVATRFRAACGREYLGNMSVSRLEDPAELFNGVIYEGERFYLVPNPELVFFDHAMASLLDGLGLSKTELFPIAFTLRVPFDGEPECRSGILDGRKNDMSM